VWGIDQNGVADADEETWILHWPAFRKQYPYVWTGRYIGTGPTRREERILVPEHWPAHVWDLRSEQVDRLRSRRIGGRRPHRARTHMHLARELDVPWILEVKHSPAYRHPGAWAKLRAARIASGIRKVGVMTLQTQWVSDQVAYAVLEKAVEAGFGVALLPRRGKPRDWNPRWVLLGVRQWGPWRHA
jgi:DNA-binding transcriptional LysR family regulator